MTALKTGPNFDKWLNVLEATDLPQANSSLIDQVRIAPGESATGYCCLGIGCVVAEIPQEVWVTDDLAPREFIDWLGLPNDGKGDHDIYPDWPDELRDRSTSYLSDTCSASAMNDSGMTFKQIAQVFRYFGVRRVS